MDDQLPDRVRAFLASPRYATIATLDPDGAPHQAVTWYLPTDDGIVINSRRGRHWPSNLVRDSRIAMAVFDLVEPYHWFGLKGRGDLLREGDAATEDIMAMARRYGSDPERFRGQDRVSFLVRVEDTFEYGG